MNCLPAVRPGDRDVAVEDEALVGVAGFLVAFLLVLREINVDAAAVRYSARKSPESSRDLAAIDDGADQVRIGLLHAVGAFRRGGQSQAEWRQAADRGHRVRRAGQVVALVEDEQAEAIAPAFHMDVRRVVGGHRERLDVVIAAAHQADGAAEGLRQFPVPLVQQVDCRRDYERRPGGFLDRQDRSERLARCPWAARRRRELAIATTVLTASI